jgi:hypothetical protein
MLSATYQQGSGFRVQGSEGLSHSPEPRTANPFVVDPDNRWLWRMSRRRLDIEAWRDSLLAAGGNLDRQMGGPSVSLADDNSRRRTLYARIERYDLEDILRLFDFPEPGTHSPDREPTTTSLQQLFVLNSSFMRQQSQSLAARLLAGGDASSDSVIRQAYQQLFAREPTPRERELALQFLGGQSARPPDEKRVQAYAQALLSSSEFLFVD